MSTSTSTAPANIINHIGFIIDASGSMAMHAQNVIRAADAQISYLAQRSKELDQETRVSVWVFNDRVNIRCVVWDKDVLRLPSIAKYYSTGGMTAFIDATLTGLNDLAMTPEKYGDHSFLVYVLTDGMENNSRSLPTELHSRLTKLPDHWTVAALVPSPAAVHETKKYGFPAGNIQIWNTTSHNGITEVSERIRQATDNYMVGRSTGIRSTRTLFSTDATAVNAQTIAAANLKPLARGSYLLVPVDIDGIAISDFTKRCGHSYKVGNGYYELMKRELIAANKKIVIVEKANSANVFAGDEARQMLGLRDADERVTPNHNPAYKVFVQSTSNNRKLKIGTQYLFLL